MFIFRTAVVGAGTVGAELAYVIAAAGLPVVLADPDRPALDAALQRARDMGRAEIDAGLLTAETLDARLALIEPATALDGCGTVDFAVEAVPERLDVKQEVFIELDAVLPGHAIIASTTSALSISELAETTARPDRVVGFHFTRSPARTRVVEVVEGEHTSPETLQAAAGFAQTIRRTAVRCGEAPGYVVHRIQFACVAELWRAQQGRHADMEVFDELLTAATATGESPDALAARLGLELTYGEGLEDQASITAFVEACNLLEDGVAALRDIELGAAAGAGIVPGPFARADSVGLDAVIVRLERAEREWGEAFEPPVILRRLAGQGRLGVATGQGFLPHPRPDRGWEDRPVKLETRGPVAIAWLDRPPANSIAPETAAELHRIWERVAADDAVRVLVIASANPNLFCAGADIKAFAGMDADASRSLFESMHALLRSFERSPVVTIAAVGGLALGGGCELAMGCDIRIASESAIFGQPEINLGIIPGFGGTQRLPRLVGTSKALEMNLTGEPVSADEAYELGLVNRLVPDHELLDTALVWARYLATRPPLAVAEVKRVSGHGDLDAGLEAEQAASARLFVSEDAREGFTAFVAKRPPTFRGR